VFRNGVLTLVVVIPQLAVVVLPSHINDNRERVKHLQVPGPNNLTLVVLGKLPEEPDAGGFVGLEGAGVGSDFEGGIRVGGIDAHLFVGGCEGTHEGEPERTE